MVCTSGIASSSSVLVSVRTALERALEKLSEPADFGFLFVSGPSISERAAAIIDIWQELVPHVPVFGGSAESLVGSKVELEGQCAASVLLVSGIRAQPQLFELECIKTPDGPSVMGISDEWIQMSPSGILLIACPKTFSMEILANAIDYERPTPEHPLVSILGGYCSSQNWQEPCVLFCGERYQLQGAVALTLPQEWRWQTVISQGCRPVGDPFIITEMDGQTVVSLGGKPAMHQLRQLFSMLPANEQQMFSKSLMIGRAINEYADTFSHGEFLVRSVQGVDPDNQGLVVTDRFQVGQTVRFHVRDEQAATADFRDLLSKAKHGILSPEAALLFSCNGRGTRMFSNSHHDAMLLDEYFPDLPLAGMFAAGEFGPISNSNLVHGFTAIANLLVRNKLPSTEPRQ